MIGILLAEEHQIVRNGLKNIIEQHGDFHVVAEVGSARELIKILDNEPKPDVILADINTPAMGGVELISQINAVTNGEIKLIVLTMNGDEQLVLEALKNGAHGYLHKSVALDELVFALSHVHRGNLYVSSEITSKLLNIVRHRVARENGKVDFSKRETEVLALISKGLTNNEIADKLFTSRRTIEGHRQAMINKARVKNSAELIRFAVTHSIID